MINNNLLRSLFGDFFSYLAKVFGVDLVPLISEYCCISGWRSCCLLSGRRRGFWRPGWRPWRGWRSGIPLRHSWLVPPYTYVQVFGNCVPVLILFFTICLICCYYILRKIKANNTDGSGFGFLKSGSGSAKKPIRSNSVPDRIRKHCTLKQKSMLFRTVEVVIWLKNALLGSGLQDGGYEPVWCEGVSGQPGEPVPLQHAHRGPDQEPGTPGIKKLT